METYHGHYDFTAQGRRPSPAQIIKRWVTSGKPNSFGVTYGETYAEFTKRAGYPTPTWDDSGNGCRGVNRSAVVKALLAVTAKNAAKFQDLMR